MTSQFVSLNKFFRTNPTNEVRNEWLQAVATKNMSMIVELLYERLEAFVEEVNDVNDACINDRKALNNCLNSARRIEDGNANKLRAKNVLYQLRGVERATRERNINREIDSLLGITGGKKSPRRRFSRRSHTRP
jgi:hypothetical protein